MSKISRETVNRCVNAIIQSSKANNHNTLESVELHIVLKDYDPQRGSFSSPVSLQFLTRSNMQVCLLGDQRYCEAESLALPFMDLVTLKRLNKSKRYVKTRARKYDAYLGPAAIIKTIPRLLGIGLNQAGKFPSALSHRNYFIGESDEGRATVVLQGMKKINRHMISIGHVEMAPEELTHNLYLSISYLVSLLKKNWQNVRSLHIKSTMGSAYRLY